MRMDISVVIPLYNEEESLPELYAWIERVMKEHGFSYEVIFVDDGSTDHSWDVVKELSTKHPDHVRGASFRRNYGKSPALNTGFRMSRGEVVITMDADLQDSPDEIPELYRMIREDGYDLVSGFKKKRYDPLSKTIPTKLFNATARRVSGIHNLHDFNCGLKAYSSRVVKHIEVYGDMHRYIPFLAKQAGFDKIGEKVVHHQARKYGKTKFGLDRFVNGYLDLATLLVYRQIRQETDALFRPPWQYDVYTRYNSGGNSRSVETPYHMHTGAPYILVTDSPYFYISLVLMILGSQLFLAGFVGELVVRNSPRRNDYEIEAEIDTVTQ